jgi:hypothetical protein
MTNLEKLIEIKDTLYGHGFTVNNWHLNGEPEPIDNWFDQNDWEPDLVSDFDAGVAEGIHQQQDKIDRIWKFAIIGGHHFGCHGNGIVGPCTCGLENLIAEIEDKP